MRLRLPEKGEYPKFDEWVIVLGGSGTIGQFSVQESPSKAPLVIDLKGRHLLTQPRLPSVVATKYLQPALLPTKP